MNIPRKKHHSFRALFFLCVTLVLGATVCVWAQPPEPTQPAKTETPQWRSFRLHYTSPEVMAYFLDPQHHPVPGAPLFSAFPDHLKKFMTLPRKQPAPFAGILAPDNSKETLWILSDKKLFDQTRQRVNLLDKPTPFVELRVKVVAISPEYIRSIPLLTPPLINELKPPNGKPPYILSTTLESSEAIVGQLLAQGKATLIQALTCTTMNNMPGAIGRSSASPVELGVKKSDGRYDPLIDMDKEQLHLAQMFSVSFIPTTNNDNSITVLLNISVDRGLETTDDTTLWMENLLQESPLTAKLTLRHDQTAIITGLTTTALHFDDTNRNVAIFVTAHERKDMENR